ncbi:MAG: 16S rRNA (uracil(1498)-N(3))-methyltransferase [Robiginitomaculum sp.]|nr:MAG: 16S rRNA (uracil(1498)-N(3))-methyltransferase [Robiginitomaculum sp.]
MHHIPRLYVDQDLAAGLTLALNGEQSHYVAKVMRQRVGGVLRLFNGRDGEWKCEITKSDRKQVDLTVGSSQFRAQTICPDLHLVFAPIKRSRMEFIVEKATELGVRHMQIARSEYANQKSVRLERLHSIMREAAEQTERLDLPDLAAESSLQDWLSGWTGGRNLIFCDESGAEGGSGTRPILDALNASLEHEHCTILIGPEGGFSATERAQIRKLPSAIPVSLGPRILRADTAAIAALSLVQAVRGDWRN